MEGTTDSNAGVSQAQGPPPMYPPQQPPPGNPPYYPPQPGYGGPGMPPPQPPGGYYPQPDIGDTLSDSFNLYKNNFMAFFSFWAIPAILGIILSLMPLIILGGGLTDIDTTGDTIDLVAIIGYAAFSVMFLIIYVIIYLLFAGGLIGMTKQAMDTGKTDMSMGFDTIKKYFGNILITTIVVGLIITIGFALCCIPGILFCYWWMFAVTIVVIEGVGLGDAMSKSKNFAETRHTFLFAVVLIIVIIVVSFLGDLISGSISWGLQQALGEWPGIIISTVIGEIFQWVIAPFLFIAIAVHYIKGRAPPVPIPPSQYPQPPYQQQPYQPPPQYPQDQYGPPPQ
jgi:hypothetical protein